MNRQNLIQALGDTLGTAWETKDRQPLPEGDWSSFSMEDAHAVQKYVAEKLGWFPNGHPAAWKLGGSPESGAATAPVVKNAILYAPCTIAHDFSTAYGVEAEIGIRLGHSLSPGCTAAQVWEAIDGLCVCVEICDTRLSTAGPLPAAIARADNQTDRAIILGPWFERPQTAPDWRAMQVDVVADGNTVYQGTGGHPFGDPLTSMVWLTSHAAREWSGLQAGDVVATGTWSGMYWAHQGEALDITFSGLGSLRFSIAHPPVINP